MSEWILVTGAAGFIGSNLSKELLSRNYKVIGIDSFEDYYSTKYKERNVLDLLDNKNFYFKKINIFSLKLEDLKGISYVIHEAAQPGVRRSFGEEFKIYVKNNILATQYLLELTKDLKTLKKFIFASSSSVYGDTSTDTATLNEDTSSLCPISPYGVSKLAAEKLVYAYSRNFSLPAVSLRYFTVYGPKQRPDMAFFRFIQAILNNKEIVVYGNGSQSRDFIYIDDVVFATLSAMVADLPDFTIINIANGKTISINKVLEILKDIVPNTFSVRYTDWQKGDVRSTCGDITKAKKLLNFTRRVDIEDGLESQYHWFVKTYETG